MPTDKKIIARFKAGDAEAFDVIYHQYSKKMFSFAYGLVKDVDVSKELVQEVFVSLWEKRDQVDPNLNLDNYIFTNTYNSVRKYFRKRAIEIKVIDRLVQNSPEIGESTDATLIYNELFEIASKTIENLPPKRKLVYQLHKQEGLKIKEIASRLNISPRTVENNLAKAVKYLKEELAGMSIHTLLFFYLFLK